MPKLNLIKRVASVMIFSLMLPMSVQASCASLYQATIASGNNLGTLIQKGEELRCRPFKAPGMIVFDTPQECIDGYESAKEEVEIWKNNNNVNSGPNHIGPRICAPAHTYSGNVKAERVFFCTPVVKKNWTLDLKLTGGKGKKPLKVTVCMLDRFGGSQGRTRTQTFNGAKDNVGAKFENNTWKDATGYVAMIHLEKQTGTRGYKYELKVGEKGGEPSQVKKARRILAVQKKSSGKIRKK